ncbi:hypothetical protein C1645_810615 [Glomus cerebriforme]|uniref:PNPLA domain-containing protein n=1 Tax=Glomus cerebriforme TaxID=658196 RepID=A0A397SB82_9GLOM|nr:hypothetical protein C1645_810615 [Glomus cerebriforme]
MISQIENFFLETENLIKSHLQDNVQNKDEIKEKFKEGKKLIDELEEDDEEQYNFFKYKYHTTYASYLKTVGEYDNANKQQNLAKKFSGSPNDDTRTNSILFRDAKLDITQDFNPTEEISILNDVNEQLEKIQSILNEKFIETIKQIFNFNGTLKTFKEYQEIVEYEVALHKAIDSLIIECLEASQSSETNELNEVKEQSEQNKNNSELVDSLNHLRLLAVKANYPKRITFIRHVLNSPNKKEILFSDILFTEEGINKHSRNLSSYFHPDKTNQPNTSNFLQDEHKNLGADLFKIIQEFKEKLLTDLINVSNPSFHETKANKLWKLSIDYRNAARGQWEKLKLLKKEDIKEYSSEELENFSLEKGELAYQEYRAACKIADKAKQLKKQVKLRGNMALCYYVTNKFLEAQLYALSAIKLQFKYSQEVAKQDLIEAKNIFEKVKGGNAAEKTSKLNTEINLNDNSDNAFALIKIVDQEFSFYEKKRIESSIKEDMKILSKELILKADRSLVRYQASKEEILHAKKRAFSHKVAGVATMGYGIGVGGAIITTVGYNIYTGVAIGVATISASAFFIVTGIAALGLGIFCGYPIWKKGVLLMKEPKIREKLNEIMSKALKEYDEGNNQEFLNQLSEEYDKDDEKRPRRLFKLEERDDDIIPKDIIDTLLKHGFRSDGIAYLLNLLGEVLNSRKVKIKGKTTGDLEKQAYNAFLGVLNEKLKEEAKKLDVRINEFRNCGRFKNCFKTFIDAVLLKEYSNIAKEHMDDAQEMPFQSRLEEMCNIARINLTIFDILFGDKEEFDRAIETIREIRDSMNCYQFISTAKSRLEALEDLLWVISGDELPGESPELSRITFPVDYDYMDNKYLCYLNEKLQRTSSNKEKIVIYNKIAVYYEISAEKESKINQLNSLKYWCHAQKNYESIREVDPKNLNAALGFAKCLLKLSKYTRVIGLLSTNSDLTSLSEYWRYCSIAHCKKINYKKANECIVHSLRLDPKNNLAGRQREFLKKLIKEKIEYRIHRFECENKSIRYEKDYFENSRNNKSTYNVLSIDGGGIRGVLPALWLSEIEHRTHRPISHLFNMIAGTSTGGIIAAGLSAPYSSDASYYSDFKPKFSALELLNFYQDKMKELFDRNSWWNYFINSSNTSKFDHYFRNHFGQTTLSQALTELVIPAVYEDENNLKQTHLFTHYDALTDSSKDDIFVDALMATTAAPTFFQPHKPKDKSFLDGGIHLNNPAMTAYNETIRYGVANKNVSVLSLGTGSYIPDPLKPDQYLDKLFWPKYSNNAQEVNTDSQMYDMLGSRYQRWQVWFENPIQFDGFKSIPDLLEIGNQYIEELDASDENPMNKLESPAHVLVISLSKKIYVTNHKRENFFFDKFIKDRSDKE